MLIVTGTLYIPSMYLHSTDYPAELLWDMFERLQKLKNKCTLLTTLDS